MSVAIAAEPRIVHSLPGRVRVHVPGWKGQEKRRVEAQLRGVMGVQRVQANALTGNMLIYFDLTVTNEQAILTAVWRLDVDMTAEPAQEPPPPPVMSERRGRTTRARIAVRGLDRDPHLAKRVVEHLNRHPGVQRASVSLLTGRVLVEFAEEEAELEDLLAAVAGLELPELPGEDRPAHPLDPGPLLQSAVRTGGATLGLGLLATRRLFGLAEPLPGAPVALRTAVVIGILQGIPPLRFGLRKLLGRTVADLLFSIPGIVTLTIAGSSIGLTLGGVEALRLLTEVLARRSAWRLHEERGANAATVQPGAVIHLEAGERVPLPAKVIEGTGTAIGSDGMPVPVVQGGTVPSGVLLYGGPFALQLHGEEAFQPFMPEPRPPSTPSLYERYLQAVGPFSLIYAAATALLTRSFSQTLAALLLVSSRTATVGLEVLTGGVRNLPARQQTLRNTIQWSYDLLSQEEQRLFRQLAIFVGGCTLEAATAVAQTVRRANTADSDRTMEVLEGVASLQDKSLLQQTEQEAEVPRFVMLETIREYGLMCLQACGELETTRRAHTAYYLRLAEEAAEYHCGAQAVARFEVLEREQENLRAALQWALERQDEEAEEGIEIAVRLGWALWRFWTIRGHVSEGRTLLERVLAASERSAATRAPVRAKALLTTAFLAWYQGDYPRGEELCGEALTLLQQLGDQQGLAFVFNELAGYAMTRRDYAQARILEEESLALFQAAGNTWGVAFDLMRLGQVASALGEYSRASQLFEESLSLFRTLGYPGDIAWPLLSLAHDAIGQAEYTRALSLLEEGLVLCRQAGNKWGMAYALSLLGQVTLEQGDMNSATAHLSESLQLNREVGHRQSVARSLLLLASAVALQGDYARAHSLYEEALTIATTLQKRELMASCLEGLATVLTMQGEPAWAARLWGAAETTGQGHSATLPRVIRATVEHARAAACTSLGEQVFAAALASGRAMSPQEALAAQQPLPLPRHEAAAPAVSNVKTRFSEHLTRREVEVLRLVAAGLTDAQVAKKLVISPGTVSWYMRSICGKLGVSSRTAATRPAIEQHLL